MGHATSWLYMPTSPVKARVTNPSDSSSHPRTVHVLAAFCVAVANKLLTGLCGAKAQDRGNSCLSCPSCLHVCWQLQMRNHVLMAEERCGGVLQLVPIVFLGVEVEMSKSNGGLTNM